MSERERLQQALLRRAAAGELDAAQVVRVLAASGAAEDLPSATALADWLEGCGTPEAEALAERLGAVRCAEIRRCRKLVDAGEPIPAELASAVADLSSVGTERGFADDHLAETLRAALKSQLDCLALAAKGIEGAVGARLAQDVAAHRTQLAAGHGLWTRLLPPVILAERLLAEPGRVEREADREVLTAFVASQRAKPTVGVPPVDDWRFRLRACASRSDARKVVDELCLWPTRELAEVIPAALEEPWQRRRAVQLLVWRFGIRDVDTWSAAVRWLAAETERWKQLRQTLDSLSRERPAELLLFWCGSREDIPPSVIEVLTRQCAGAIAGTRPLVLEMAYRAELSPEERQKLAPPTTPPRLPPTARAVAPAAEVPGVPPEPAPPTVWDQYLRPFLTENWLLVAGILGVLAGVSVLVYRYWQSTWIIRYAVVQALLLGGTLAAARLASWLERQDAKLRDTALLLTGAAVLLVPVNVLCPVMLASGAVGAATLLAPALGLGLLLGFGWWLQRVLGRVLSASGGRPLGWSLSAMQGCGFASLLLMSQFGAAWVPITLGCLPYVLLVAGAWGLFSLPKNGGESPLAAFVGVALGGTFLQLVAWGHLLAHAPLSAAAWAPAAVLLGALALAADYRLARGTDERPGPGRVAYAGFAVILLGLLLGLPYPWVRPGVFVLAGLAWIAYGVAKPHPVHAWIGIPLVALGVVAVAFVPAYPIAWRPAVALLVVAILEPAVWRRRVTAGHTLAEALAGTQGVFAGVAVIAAVLSQFHYRNDPHIALAVVAGAIACFAWFAYREQSARWVRVAAITGVVALPYAGFADTLGNFERANTMAFGLGLLGWLWIGLVQWQRRVPYLRAGRSTVLVTYGGCAMLAMTVRLLVQQLDPDAGLVRDWLDTAGPILVLGTLILAAYWSRSLLPAGMAAVIGAIFAPEMKAALVRALPQFGWGSGLGSACWAVALIALCFRLRDDARLRDLGPGDAWWELDRFPWLRLDHTLFTLPMILTAAFLCARVDTYVWLKPFILGKPLIWKTCLALVVSGLAWLAGAVYLDRVDRRLQRLCGYLGAFWFSWGFAQLYWVLGDGGWHDGMLWFCVTLQILHAMGLVLLSQRFGWAEEVAVKPARRLLVISAVALTSELLFWLGFDGGVVPVALLAAFCVGQLIWHGWRTGYRFHGWLLLAFLLVLAASAELGGHHSLDQIDGPQQVCLYPLLLLVVALVLSAAAEHWYAPAGSRGNALIQPLLLGSGGLALLAGTGMIAYVLIPHGFRPIHFWVAAGFVLLASRANGWSVPTLFGVLAVGLLLAAWGVPRGDMLAVFAAAEQPWKLGLFACCLLVCTHGGRWGYRRWPWLLVSPWAPWPCPSAEPFTALGVVVAGAGVVRHLTVPAYRDAPEQVGAPFLSALALAAAASTQVARLAIPLLSAAGVAVGVGCVLAVRVSAGPWLRPLGAEEVHLIALGLVATLVLAEAVAFLARKRWPAATFRWMCAVPAAVIPVLLVFGYLASPGLDHTNAARCLISGLCLLVAAVPFRRFRQVEGELPLALGSPVLLALAVASLSMAVPWLRQPQWALSVLLLPALVLLILAEVRERQPETWRTLNTALVFGVACVPVLLHAVPALYRALCFSTRLRWLAHFHTNALVPLVAGLILARLAAKHRHRLSAYLAGPLLSTGVYAVVAQWPLVWSFERIVLPATVWLLTWAHIWLGLMASPTVRRWLVGDLDSEDVRRIWRRFVWVASQIVVLCVILRGSLHSYAGAPLLAGAASVLMHAAVSGGKRWLGILAMVELTVAIHLDYLTPSYLPRDWVIWVLLGIWVLLLLADGLLRGRLRRQAAAGSQALVLLVFAQVCHWDPGSAVGLIGMVLGAALYALAPLAATVEQVPMVPPGALLLLLPAWVAFWLTGGRAADLRQGNVIRACLAASCGLLVVAPLAVWNGVQWPLRIWTGWRPRLVRQMDVVAAWLREQAGTVDLALLIAATCGLLAAAFQLHLARPDVALCVGLGAVLMLGWWRTGKRRQEMVPIGLCLGVLLLVLYIVRTWLLDTGRWQVEYDLWAGLALSSVACVLERWFAGQPDYARGPLFALYWLIPAANTLLMLSQRMWGSDLPLLVSGIHAMQFGYLGRRERGSPYRAAAVGGAVLFCLIAFATRLHLRQAYAYIVPIGLGVLALVQLFGERMKPQDRNTIRAVAVLSMLGSTGYYVIADSRLSLVHILVLGLLCLFCMGVAAVTRVRAYLYLGFTGFVVDLLALLYRVLVRLEHMAQMTLIGVLVLGTGVALVAGSLYYKLHRERLLAKLQGWAGKLRTWE